MFTVSPIINKASALRGLGAYPDQSYYDPNRPSWLPYWIDTPTESAGKYGTDNLFGQMGGAVGSAAGDAIGGAVSNFGSSVVDTATGSSDPLGNSSSLFGGSVTTVLLVVGAGLIALKVLEKI